MEELKKGTHQLCALAFVPEENVERNFVTLRSELPKELNEIADYFEATYIRKRRVRRRSTRIVVTSRPPRYPPSLWNHYESVLDGSARTNNLPEG